MEKNLLARQSWTIKGTEINYLVYVIEDDPVKYYEVEILHETFRLRRNEAGVWTGLDGETNEDITKWGEVVEIILKTKNKYPPASFHQ